MKNRLTDLNDHLFAQLERLSEEGLTREQIEAEANGPVPDGMALKCKGDRLNTDPSNWELVPRGLLPRLNGKSGRDYDHAPAELKPTIMAVAKLEHRIREKVQP